jgi:predicted O-methyltransferase YrrM
MNLAQFDKKDWVYLSASITVISAGSGAWIAWDLSGGNWVTAGSGGLLASLIVGPLLALLGSVNTKLNFLRRRGKENHLSLREMINIRPLLDGPPLDYDHWAMDPYLGKVLAQTIARHRPTTIVECGSGTSTVFMAYLLQQYGVSGRVTALDHLDQYASRSRQLIKEHECTEYAQVVTAPLESLDVNGDKQPWYGVDFEQFAPQSIDLLLVDGPPANTGPQARYPAVPLLQPYLAEDCLIIMDDGKRASERQTAHQWTELLDADLERAGGPKGTFVIRC